MGNKIKLSPFRTVQLHIKWSTVLFYYLKEQCYKFLHDKKLLKINFKILPYKILTVIYFLSQYFLLLYN